jgi:hypothetical protein
LLLLVVQLIPQAHAQHVISGRDMLLPCTRSLTGGDESMPMAFCVGAIVGIASTAAHLQSGSRFCIPADASRGEQVAAVVRYMKSNALRLHEDFFLLAFQALRQTWPCPLPGP